MDAAATSRQKPPQVLKAVVDYASFVGVSHGRGAYGKGIAANEMVYGTRAATGQTFWCDALRPHPLATKNVTEALNTALKGFLKEGDHVVLSSLEHNAVIRPLNKLKATRGIDYTIVQANAHGRLNPYDFLRRPLTPATKLVLPDPRLQCHRGSCAGGRGGGNLR